MLAQDSRLPREAVPAGSNSQVRLRIMENKTNSTPPSPAEPADYSRWANLVERIQADDETGMAELYDVFSAGIRFYLCRQLGAQDLDDRVHDMFLVVIEAIRRGEVREPSRLMGFVRTVARRHVAACIAETSHRRRDELHVESGAAIEDTARSPEGQAIALERIRIMKEVLMGISPRDREILTRFYLSEESQEQICREMGLNSTQFRLLKSRAKARFGEIGRRKLARRSLANFFLRFSSREEH